MARQDIAGLLTGMPSGRADPMGMGGNSSQQRLAFGAQRAEGLQRGVRGMMGGDTNTPAEQLQIAMANLDLSNPADLRKMTQIQQATGDTAGAAQTASRLERIEKEAAALAQQTTERESLIRIAKAQGDSESVDYLTSGGSTAVMASKLLSSGGQGKASTLTQREEDLYDIYFDGIAPAAAKAAGLTKAGWFGSVVEVAGGRQKLAELAEHTYENAKGRLTREQALLQVLQGPTSNAGQTVAGVANLAQSNQGGSATPVDPFAGKKARTP